MRSTTLVLALSLAATANAQNGQATHMVVDKTGVYDRVSTGRITQKAPPQTESARALRWRWKNPTAQKWIVRSVGASNGGTMGWFSHQLNGRQVSLVATTDDAGSTPKPIRATSVTNDIILAAADKAPFCVTAHRTKGTVDYRSAMSSKPLFTLTHSVNNGGAAEVAMSDNGRLFAVGFAPNSTSSQVMVYDGGSSTPKTPIAGFKVAGSSTGNRGFRHIDISPDGLFVLLATHTTNHLFDVIKKKEISTAKTVSHDAHTVSRLGLVWARGGFDIGIWVRASGGYKRILSTKESGMGFPVASACDLSADGSTFAVASYDARNSSAMHLSVYKIDIGKQTAKLVWTYKSPGSGSRQNSPRAVSVSDDGRWVAVGTWGAQTSGPPEAMLFDTSVPRAIPVGSVDTPGSVFDVDLSGDGQFLLVGSKSVHANVFGNGGSAWSYDRGGQGHWLAGTASLGRTVKLNADGTKGDVVLLAVSAGLASPITLPGIGGTLDLDTTKLLAPPGSIGTVPASGTLTVPVTVPNLSALLGFSIYTQTLRGGTSPTFKNWLMATITP